MFVKHTSHTCDTAWMAHLHCNTRHCDICPLQIKGYIWTIKVKGDHEQCRLKHHLFTEYVRAFIVKMCCHTNFCFLCYFSAHNNKFEKKHNLFSFNTVYFLNMGKNVNFSFLH
jgi:hypothetical protein